MTIQDINTKAKESLNTYFKDATDIKHEDVKKEPYTYQDMVNKINMDVKLHEEHARNLENMKRNLEKDAKTVMEYYVHETNAEDQNVEHYTVDQMEKVLHEETQHQLDYANTLKQQAMHK